MSIEPDLHSHSTASDGTLSPAELVAAAHAAGIRVLALTDHDSTDGIAEARTAAACAGIDLVAGVEISVSWESCTVHILGLGIDPRCEPLQAGLERLRRLRDRRAEEIARRLQRAGITGALEGATAYASGRIVSRTHFARFLVDQGHARSLQDVFRRYLVHGRPGHVRCEWAGLDEAIGWIRAAGGQAVIAHPARYRLTASKLRRLVADFREAGGVGLEVVSGSHTRNDTFAMASLARRADLLASRGSDYHGPGSSRVKLGELEALPAGCVPLWESPHWVQRHGTARVQRQAS